MRHFLSILLLLSGSVYGQSVPYPRFSENMQPVTPTSGVTFVRATPEVVNLTDGDDITLLDSFVIKPGVPGTMGTMRHFNIGYKGGFVSGSGVSDILTQAATQGVYWIRARQVKETPGRPDTAFFVEYKIVVHPNSSNRAEAGSDTTIYTPSQSVFRIGGVDVPAPDPIIRLDGGGSRGGSTWAWTRISGPNTPTITSPTATATTVTGIIPGTYVFRLTVNGSMTDDVTVTYIDKPNEFIATQNRVGAPVKFLLPPTRTWTTNGVRGAEYVYPNLRDWIAANTGNTLQGGDTIDLDLGTGRDSITKIIVDRFGGTSTADVIFGPTVSRWNMKHRLAEFYVGMNSGSVRYVRIDGTMLRSKGEPYGIRLDNREAGKLYPSFKNGSGNSMFKVNFYFGFVQNLTVKGIKAQWTGGFKAKMEGSAKPPAQAFTWVYQYLTFEDIWVENSDNEAFYIGSTDPGGTKIDEKYSPSPRHRNITLKNIIVLRAMWNAVQLANCIEGAHIENIFAYNAGAEGIGGQKSAIELGGNSNGYIKNSIVKKGTGNAYSVFGHGETLNEVSGNVGDSVGGIDFDSPGIYAQAISTYYEFYPPNRVNLADNILTMRSGFPAFKLEDTGPNMGASTINNNKVIYAGTLAIAKTSGVVPSILEYSGEVNTPYTGNVGTQINFEWTYNGIEETTTGYKIYGTIKGIAGQWTSIAAWNSELKTKAAGNNAAPYIQPESRREISLPKDSVHFALTVTDLEGNAITYAWTKISALAGTITNPTAKNAIITGLAVGTHTFRLTASDATGSSSQDFEVHVNESGIVPNVPPTAEAGGDASITLPSVVLSGSGTDSDGFDLLYSWTKISGPGDPIIITSMESETVVTGLMTGTYVFRLTVTDDDGAMAFDDVQVVVTLPVVDPGSFQSGRAGKIYKKQ